MENSDAPIIPVYLDKLWDSIFSYRGGKFFWKLPRRIPVEVSVSFGAPMPSNSTAAQVRQRVQELGTESQLRGQSHEDVLGLRLLQSSRLRPLGFCMADQSGEILSYGEVLGRVLILSRQIKLRFAGEHRIGVLMPPCITAALLHMAIIFAGKTVVNIPYGPKRGGPDRFIRATDVKHVITGREWLHGLQIEHFEQAFYLEDWNWFDSTEYWHARLALLALPAKMLISLYGDPLANPNDPVAILWSMNSAKSDKPVVLSHQSILYPVNSFMQVFDEITSDDKIIATVPLFTTMGILCNLWLPMLHGMGVVFHHNARTKISEIGALIKEHRASVIFDMPRVFKAFYEQLPPEAFSYIRFAIMGGESVTMEFLEQFEEYFGTKLYEGYGNTETGPVTMNIPDVRSPGNMQRGTKMGSFGQPLPYVTIKIVDPETFEELPMGEKGTLLVKTPFRMLGYLNDPHATQAAFHDDWYITGDEASVDAEGFVFFTNLSTMP
jgi:acyl-[acyl-carrier-protein]-phospholipid O-acyltransferase/long-chain-fatty-acid--[acyl-carrier-protein] ligase